MPALAFPPVPFHVPAYRPIRAVLPYGADDAATVKIPSDIARELGYTSRKVPVTALHGILVALSSLKSAAVAAGSNSKAKKIQKWIDQIYAMEQANPVITTGGRAQDGYRVTPPASTGGGSRPEDAPDQLEELPEERSALGMWVAAGALLAAVSGAVYWYSKKPRSNGRRRNGKRRHARRHNPSCCTCAVR